MEEGGGLQKEYVFCARENGEKNGRPLNQVAIKRDLMQAAIDTSFHSAVDPRRVSYVAHCYPCFLPKLLQHDRTRVLICNVFISWPVL